MYNPNPPADQLFKFFESYSGVKFHRSYGSYKQVFLDSAHARDTASYATLAYISTDLVLDRSIIELVLETRLELTKLVCMQAFGHFILPRTWYASVAKCMHYHMGMFLTSSARPSSKS